MSRMTSPDRVAGAVLALVSLGACPSEPERLVPLEEKAGAAAPAKPSSPDKKTHGGAVTPTPTAPERAPVVVAIKDVERPARLAGKWYEKDPSALVGQLDGFLGAADKEDGVEPIPGLLGVIVPHAGYSYSGRTAASAYRLVKAAKPKRIFVLGPSHTTMIRGVAVVEATTFGTPLGPIPIDVEALSTLLKHPLFLRKPEADTEEHSLEIHMPFIRHVAPQASVVPLIVGRLTLGEVKKIAALIHSLLRPGDLIVASSDFTHYGKRFRYVPFTEDVEQNLKHLDMDAWSHIESGNLERFWRFKHKTEDSICGFQPISILMAVLRSAPTKAKLARYDTSGRITGNFTNSVSYLAIALSREEGGFGKPAVEDEFLSFDEQRRAVELARKSIAHHFETGDKLQVPAGEMGHGRLAETHGVFVTLKKKDTGALRGCIGNVVGRMPLHEGIVSMALAAAFQDRRFTPLKQEELDQVAIEVSVLTPPQKVSGPDDILIGRDGIILRKGARSALYLPQVAIEQGWGLRSTLLHLARKAGLTPEDIDDAEYHTFQGHAYEESHF